jgi:hypothetical protein
MTSAVLSDCSEQPVKAVISKVQATNPLNFPMTILSFYECRLYFIIVLQRICGVSLSHLLALRETFFMSRRRRGGFSR